jgi:hypothetical protein
VLLVVPQGMSQMEVQPSAQSRVSLVRNHERLGFTIKYSVFTSPLSFPVLIGASVANVL